MVVHVHNSALAKTGIVVHVHNSALAKTGIVVHVHNSALAKTGIVVHVHNSTPGKNGIVVHVHNSTPGKNEMVVHVHQQDRQRDALTSRGSTQGAGQPALFLCLSPLCPARPRTRRLCPRRAQAPPTCARAQLGCARAPIPGVQEKDKEPNMRKKRSTYKKKKPPPARPLLQPLPRVRERGFLASSQGVPDLWQSLQRCRPGPDKSGSPGWAWTWSPGLMAEPAGAQAWPRQVILLFY